MKPKPPPSRMLHPVLGWINEYDTINWYTEQGKRYPHAVSELRMFLDRKLKEAYKKNIEETK